MSSAFDPASFLSATTTEAAKARPPLPAGRDFLATIGEPKGRQVQGKKDATKQYIFIDFPMEIDLSVDPALRDAIGQDKVILTYGTSLDVTDGGAIDWAPGRNTGLRLMRNALNMNNPGDPFNIQAMQGRTIRVTISHEEYPEGSGEFRDRIKSVAKP